MECHWKSLIVHVEITGIIIDETPRNDTRMGILHVIVATRSFVNCVKLF